MRTTSGKASILFAFLPALLLGQTDSIWAPTVVPSSVDSGDGKAAELGLKFHSDVAGSVTGVRFYKASANKGTHTGNLWTSSGTKLATVTFAGESASGWQQASFSTPVAIQANTTYVVSYYTSVGHYSMTKSYFASASTDKAPLHAPSGSNGVYRYGTSSGFPTLTWSSSNYWVDLVFKPNSAPAAAATKTTVTSSADPSTAGQAVTFAVTVTAGSGTPTGTVQIRDGSTVLATETLGDGKASLVTSSLAAGTHSITAVYSGSSAYSTSTSSTLSQTVNSSTGTTTSLTSSVNPSTTGQAVTCTATVTAKSGTPTGTVQFRDGSTVLATNTLASGKASLVTSSLAAGTHSITAAYSGSSAYPASTSSALVQTVTSSKTTTTSLTSSANPSTPGEAVTFKATVSASSGAPTGTVRFNDGSTVLATVSLGTTGASVSVTSLAVGTHSITATYGGDSTHAASTSPALSQQVQQTVAHSVSLKWTASSSTNVTGYNVYRGAISGGPYTKLNSSVDTTTSYTDTTVQSGHTYFFVCTTVNSSNTESGYSTAVQAVVP